MMSWWKPYVEPLVFWICGLLSAVAIWGFSEELWQLWRWLKKPFNFWEKKQ